MEQYLLNKIKKYRSPLQNVTETLFTITLADTPYLLPAEPVTDRQYLVIYNGSGVNIYIGGSTVTSSNGTPLADGKYMIIPALEGVYALCSTPGNTVRLLELS